MSDLLIRGMEMPKDGHWGTVSIPIYIHGDGSVSDSKGHIIGSAVPVPPHGDLIDRDKARKTIKPWTPEDERAGCTFDTVKKLMHTLLNEAPVIIPTNE